MSRFLNHTSLRVANLQRSLDFYSKHFGMKVVNQSQIEELGFSQALIGLTGPNSLYKDAPWYSRGGLLQLTQDKGASVETFTANNGNKDPHRGFGHICFSVADLEGTCSGLEEAGVKFQKRLVDGRQKNIAFALDPDGYWIELITNEKKTPDASLAESTSRLNHSMIRVKDKDASLEFYTQKLGLSLVATKDFPEAKFTLFFLSFEPEHVKKNGTAAAESLIELTYNYGSEKDDSVKYHNGNTDPKGFRHITVATDEPGQLVKSLQATGIKVVTSQESLPGVTTVSDPDGYFVQIAPKRSYLRDSAL